MLAQYQNNPSPGNLKAAKYVAKYLKNTKNLGIVFDSNQHHIPHSFLHHPIHLVHALTDANWGAQDQSCIFASTQSLDLFKSRSIYGHIIFLYGPIHWQSKRQTITARSSAEAEIYATDECVKELQYLCKIFQDLNLQKTNLKNPIPVLTIIWHVCNGAKIKPLGVFVISNSVKMLSMNKFLVKMLMSNTFPEKPT